MINLEQDHRWIIAIYKENTLRETKERLQIILELCEDDPDIRLCLFHRFLQHFVDQPDQFFAHHIDHYAYKDIKCQ